jgi:error-prone DNA polymerase
MHSSSPYIELHAHSGYSFLDGASHPEELVLRAKELGYPALALTDHDGLYGAMEFARCALEEGIQPITGAEITVHACGFPEEETAEPPARWHLTLLAEAPRGYANLCRLLTESHRTSLRGAPSLPLASVLDRSEGLILLTGCRRSPLLRALEDSVASGEAFARRLLRAFGRDHLFVELQMNRVRGDRERVRELARLADRLGIRVVATGNVHYHRPERHRLQDVLVSIRHRSTLDASHGFRRPNAEFHLASPEEVAHRFRSRPDALVTTLRIAERCAAFDLNQDLGYVFPDFQGSERGGAMDVLTAVTKQALETRYPEDPRRAFPEMDRFGPGESGALTRRARERRQEAEARLEQELRLVDRHGLAGFFLVYRDIMELAREVGARVRGRPPGRLRASPPVGDGAPPFLPSSAI